MKWVATTRRRPYSTWPGLSRCTLGPVASPILTSLVGSAGGHLSTCSRRPNSRSLVTLASPPSDTGNQTTVTDIYGIIEIKNTSEKKIMLVS